MILLDTNILTVSKQSGNTDYIKVVTKLQQLAEDEETLIICPQNLYEFFVASTRPTAQRGLGLSRKTALKEIENLQKTYTFINDPVTLFSTWIAIIEQYETTGKQGHDARLVAFMKASGITKFYTLNTQDFNRYTDIITLVN